MKRTAIILACLLLLVLPALGQTGNFISLKYYKWYIDPTQTFDPNNPSTWKAQPFKNPGGGLAFNFPVSPQPDPNATSPWYGYLVKPFGFPITGGPLTMTFTLAETGSPSFNYMSESFNNCIVPLGVRFYVQQGDLYNATPGTRWWSSQVQYYLQNAGNGQQIVLYVPLDPSQWSDQFGTPGNQEPGNWANTFNAPSWVGMTFGGGCFFGHGGNVSNGTAEFQLTNLEY